MVRLVLRVLMLLQCDPCVWAALCMRAGLRPLLQHAQKLARRLAKLVSLQPRPRLKTLHCRHQLHRDAARPDTRQLQDKENLLL